MWSFIPKINFEKLVHLVGFIIRKDRGNNKSAGKMRKKTYTATG